jgi:glycerate dehydrogenase
MKIVITDGATLNPGDLDWKPLSEFGEIIYYDTSNKEQVKERCFPANIIITNKTVISEETIMFAPQLKMIAVSATGYNNVDVKAAKEAGIVVSNVPEYGTYSVAQHTFALLLELVNHVGINSASTKKDEWANELWSYTRGSIHELKDKTLGIVGFGRIGRQAATIGQAFGMKIIFNNRSSKEFPDARQVSLDEIFSESNIISLHCPLTDQNKQFVNLHYLSMMKPDALLINTSRGMLINEDELLTALEEGLLAGAALDVLSEEPPKSGHPLVHHPKCIVTPHNAWISFEARSRLLKETIENIRNFIKGHPVNSVIS